MIVLMGKKAGPVSKEAKRFGAEVRRLREDARMTQEELGRRLDDLSRESVGRIEHGRTPNPKDSTLRGLERELGLSRQRSAELLGKVPHEPENVAAEFERIATIPDEEDRWEAWQRLPDRLQAALRQYSADLLERAKRLAQGGSG